MKLVVDLIDQMCHAGLLLSDDFLRSVFGIIQHTTGEFDSVRFRIPYFLYLFTSSSSLVFLNIN